MANSNYTVKTRNWNTSKLAKLLLDISRFLDTDIYLSAYEDNDDKYILNTESPLKAWIVWGYFVAIHHLSGGWTYIKRPGHSFNEPFTYKSIY